jgi:hypothetical protein
LPDRRSWRERGQDARIGVERCDAPLARFARGGGHQVVGRRRQDGVAATHATHHLGIEPLEQTAARAPHHADFAPIQLRFDLVQRLRQRARVYAIEHHAAQVRKLDRGHAEAVREPPHQEAAPAVAQAPASDAEHRRQHEVGRVGGGVAQAALLVARRPGNQLQDGAIGAAHAEHDDLAPEAVAHLREAGPLWLERMQAVAAEQDESAEQVGIGAVHGAPARQRDMPRPGQADLRADATRNRAGLLRG